MDTKPSACSSLPLDLPTLTAVSREVAARARDWRLAWRMHPISASARAGFDARMERVGELESLGRWLREKIDKADLELAVAS
jgi:hypothetical protein